MIKCECNGIKSECAEWYWERPHSQISLDTGLSLLQIFTLAFLMDTGTHAFSLILLFFFKVVHDKAGDLMGINGP